jgi:hypothetical protein
MWMCLVSVWQAWVPSSHMLASLCLLSRSLWTKQAKLHCTQQSFESSLLWLHPPLPLLPPLEKEGERGASGFYLLPPVRIVYLQWVVPDIGAPPGQLNMPRLLPERMMPAKLPLLRLSHPSWRSAFLNSLEKQASRTSTRGSWQKVHSLRPLWRTGGVQTSS